MIKKFPWQLVIICIASILVFFPTRSTYFFQDDWTFLSQVIDQPFLNIFQYHERSIYRPVGQQFFFWVAYRLFGLDAIGFHDLGLLIHVINITLLWVLLRGYRNPRFFAILWYAVHPLHFVALNWLTQLDLELAVTFSLLALVTIESSKTRWRYWLGFLLYLSALFSHEIALFLPLALIIWQRRFYGLWLIAGAGVIAGKYLVNPFPLDEDYQLAITIREWTSQLRWYGLRATGIVEGVRGYGLNVFIGSMALAIALVSLFRKAVCSGLALFFIGILPVLGLSRHPLASYGVVGLLFLTIQLARSSKTMLTFKNGLLALGIILSASVIVWTVRLTHWTTSRGDLSRSITARFPIDVATRVRVLHITSGSPLTTKEIYIATLEGNQFRVLLSRNDMLVTFDVFSEKPKDALEIHL